MKNVIENHPIYHDWYFSTDEVREVNSRKVPVTVWRHLRCTACPTEAVDVIDVYTWTRIGGRRYKYAKGVTILRVSKESFLKDNFLSTTDLPERIKRMMRGKSKS